jgi:crotonobetainyl-CoA:carnitine CoA-transferase CaiB-like acyl-CoA transferase
LVTAAVLAARSVAALGAVVIAVSRPRRGHANAQVSDT